MMKIGIFGGSFDPVHLEHVALCRSAVSELGLDKLFVVPAGTPPHKQNKKRASNEDRLEMCRLAFKDEEKIVVDDFETKSGGVSYTYLTVRHFKERFPTAELFFLCGLDMLLDFPTWKNPTDILENATLAVAVRNSEKDVLERARNDFENKFHKGVVPLSFVGSNLSSTRIRIMISAGRDVEKWVGNDVKEYVKEKGLYEIPHVKEALALEKKERQEHSVRVAFFAAEYAKACKVDEEKAILASLIHDCGKNVSKDSPFLDGFEFPKDVPAPVLHQYTGAYLAEHVFKIEDEEVLDAIRYHCSGRERMTPLSKLVYLADVLEEGRTYDGVDEIRKKFLSGGLDEGMLSALEHTLEHIDEEGFTLYPLTKQAYEYLKREKSNDK